MHKYSIALCIVFLYLLCVMDGRQIQRKSTSRKQTSNEFDILIFAQRWPLTACFVWENKAREHQTHSCSLPKRNEWTIHGIWPTKYGTVGPLFCNSSLTFDPRVLAPIESELEQKWIDIQKGSKHYSFWKHEWDKHGTCAVTIEDLNSQIKYFQKAIELINEYNMIDVLAKANILPGTKHMVKDILSGIAKTLGKRGQVMCVDNEKTKESYVVEIRICFDKTLQLTNCDGIVSFPTNCNKTKEIIYPSHVPYYYATQA